jgi:hypothetical protein
MKRARLIVLVLALFLTLGFKPALAAPDEYDDSQSHPLRIAAYLLHPVGFIVEWTVFRPFHYLVSSSEATEAFFGHRPHAPIISEPRTIRDYGPPTGVPMRDPRPGQP